MTEAQKKTIEENHNLIYSFLTKYNLPIDEYYDIAAIGLCKAGMTYDGDKSKFSTHAYTCMRNSILMEKRHDTRSRSIPKHKLMSYDIILEKCDGDSFAYINLIPSNADIEKYIVLKLFIENKYRTLSQKEKQIFQLHIEGYTQDEIGNIVGSTQPYVCRIINNIKKYLSD